MENCIPEFWEREREWKNSFPTFGNGNGNEKLIPKHWEWEWEAGIPGNGREREFPLIPDPSHSSYRCVSDLLWEGLNKKSVVKDHTFHLFFIEPFPYLLSLY